MTRTATDSPSGFPRGIPDATTLAVYGGLLAGMLAGCGLGVAATLHFLPELTGNVCEFPRLDSDGVRALILKDEADRA